MTEYLNDIEAALQELDRLLEEIDQVFTKEKGGLQYASDLRTGNIRMPSGILVPFRKDKFYYDYYDSYVLKSYVRLFKHTLQAKDEIFVSVTFRIIQELGLKKIDIFFSKVLTQHEEAKARLVSVLSDWTLMSDREYKECFHNMLREKNHLLDAPGQRIFGNIDTHFSSSTTQIPMPLFKPMRRYRDSFMAECARRIPQLNFMQGPNTVMLNAYWSEMVHGNPLMLEQIFSKQQSWRLRNRLYATLWFTGQNALRRMKPLIQNKEVKRKIDVITCKTDYVWNKLVEDWKSEAKRKGHPIE